MSKKLNKPFFLGHCPAQAPPLHPRLGHWRRAPSHEDQSSKLLSFPMIRMFWMALVEEEQAMDSYDQDVLNGLVINQNVPAIRRHSSGENFWKTTKKNRYAHRRLAALRMVQALHWHDLLWVKCALWGWDTLVGHVWIDAWNQGSKQEASHGPSTSKRDWEENALGGCEEICEEERLQTEKRYLTAQQINSGDSCLCQLIAYCACLGMHFTPSGGVKHRTACSSEFE